MRGNALEKWKSIGCVFEREPVYIGGVNVWDYKWISTNEPSIKLAHPSYLNELHDFNICYIEVCGHLEATVLLPGSSIIVFSCLQCPVLYLFPSLYYLRMLACPRKHHRA